MAKKTCFLIVGLPRSGTSSIAQFLDNLGVYFGNPAHFLDTTKLKHNPIFYELQWINDFNDRVLGAWGCTYEQDVMPIEADFDCPEIKTLREDLRERFRQEFADRPVVGVKDPRICFTFPLWRDVLTELGYTVKTVLTLRAPSAIIKSNRALMPGRLSRWQRFYARHLLAVCYFTRDVRLYRFDYDLLMKDPLKYAKKKASELRLAMADPAQATRHLSTGHYHHQPDTAGTGDPWVDRIDSEMRRGRLDPMEYLEFRSVAALFVGDLNEQDREIEQALSKKDSHIHDLEAWAKEATQMFSRKDQHIIDLETLIRQAAGQIQSAQHTLVQRDSQIHDLQNELNRLRAELKQTSEELELGRENFNALSAKHADLERQCAALMQQLKELLATRKSHSGSAAP